MPVLSTIAALAMLSLQPVATEVSAPGPQGPLRGTLLAPEGEPRATLLILPGSGPTDRDGNNPMGVAAAPYRLLAEALAEQGIASVRIDKRGLFGSAAAGNANAVRVRDYVADTRSWISTIRAQSGARCVWLLGHSEGVLIALATAVENADGVCGLVLVSGAGRRMSDVLREQLPNSPFAPHLEAALAITARLERGERVDAAAIEPALMPLFAPPIQDYLIDMFAHDPAVLAGRVQVPVLIVHGQSDLQTTETDARRLAAANPRARLVLLAGVNHVLKRVEGDDRAANVAAYANPALPLADGVAEAIVEFVRP